MQTDARASVRTLAQLIVRHRVAVVVPDWNSHASDGGHAALLESVDFARRFTTDRDGIVPVGRSMGGVAAAVLTVNSASSDVSFAIPSVSQAPSPRALRSPADWWPTKSTPPRGRGLRSRCCTGHPTTSSRRPPVRDALRGADWPVEFEELDADHRSIAGAAYDPALDRYLSAQNPQTLRVADAVAARVLPVSEDADDGVVVVADDAGLKMPHPR